MTFRCKAKNGTINNVEWKYINKAWLSAVSVCSESLFTPIPSNIVPDVVNFQINIEGNNLAFSWSASPTFFTFAEVRINGGDWVFWVPPEWGGDSPGESEWEMPLSYYGAVGGDIIEARMRFGNAQQQADVTIYSANYATDSLDCPKFVLCFGGEDTPNLMNWVESITATEEISIELEGNNIVVNNPYAITEINISSTGTPGIVDITSCLNIIELNAENNPLTEIKASNCLLLEQLEANDCTSMTSIDILGSSSLNQLVVYNTLISSLNLNNITGLNYVTTQNCPNLSTLSGLNITGNGGKAYFDFRNCDLGAGTLNSFFNNLGTAFFTSKSLIDIGENPGSLLCDPGIATDKGWSIGGGPVKIFAGALEPSLASFVNGSTGTATFTKHNNDIYIDSISNLVSLDLSGSGVHGEIYLSYSYDSSFVGLDISGLTGITSIYCDYNNNLADLNVTGCSELTYLSSVGGSLTDLDCTGCSSLQELQFQYNQISSLSIADCPLNILRTTSNPINDVLNLTGKSSLTDLECPQCGLTGLTLTGCSSMVAIDCHTNGIISLDLSPCSLIQRIDASYNTLSGGVTTTGCIALAEISLNTSSLTTIDLSPAISSIRMLELSGTLISSVNLANSGVVNSYTSNCPNLAELDISGCSSIDSIYAYNCVLTSVDMSGSYPNIGTIHFETNSLDTAAINAIFTALPTKSGFIDIESNPGTNGCDPSIAAGKGWTVQG